MNILLHAVVGRHNGQHVPRVRDSDDARQEVGRLRRSDRRHVGREHEHGARRQQETLSDEWRGHPDVSRHESDIRDDGLVTGFGERLLLDTGFMRFATVLYSGSVTHVALEQV